MYSRAARGEETPSMGATSRAESSLTLIASVPFSRHRGPPLPASLDGERIFREGSKRGGLAALAEI
jgi:hypothetical protein